MARSRAALLPPAAALLHPLAREADRGLGLVLQSEVEPLSLLTEVGRAAAADGAAVAGRIGLWLAAGLAAWAALAWSHRREGPATRDDALRRQAVVFAPLLLRPALTALALVSVAARPSYPYGFTLLLPSRAAARIAMRWSRVVFVVVILRGGLRSDRGATAVRAAAGAPA